MFSFKPNFPLIIKQNRYREKSRNIAKKIADNSEPAPSKKRIYCVKFNDSWCNKFKFIQKSRKGEGFALCTVCGSDFSIAHGGENYINRHKNTSEHRGYVNAAQQQRKLTDIGGSSAAANLNQKVVEAELLFSGFLVEHNLPLSTTDHAAQLFRNMFPDSKIVNKHRCGRTKTTHMLTGAVAKQITSNLKEELLLTRWYGLATNGTSDEDDKFFPVLVRYVDKDS